MPGLTPAQRRAMMAPYLMRAYGLDADYLDYIPGVPAKVETVVVPAPDPVPAPLPAPDLVPIDGGGTLLISEADGTGIQTMTLPNGGHVYLAAYEQAAGEPDDLDGLTQEPPDTMEPPESPTEPDAPRRRGRPRKATIETPEIEGR